MAGLRVDRCVCERVIEGKSRARQHLVESERPSLWDWSAAMIIFGLYNMYLNMSSYVEETASKGPNWISTNTKKPVPTLWLVLTALINHRYKIESWDFWCIKYALMCLMSSEDNLRLRQKLCDVIWKCSRRSEASVNVRMDGDLKFSRLLDFKGRRLRIITQHSGALMHGWGFT